MSIILPGLESYQEDGGELREKAHLPVKQLRFGDTGTPLDDKEGAYTLGKPHMFVSLLSMKRRK